MPDGKRILFLCGSYSAYGLCLADVKNGGVRKISPRRVPVGYAFELTADGRTVAFTNDKGVYVMSLPRGQLRNITKSGYHLSWSPDGKWILVGLKSGLHAIRISDALVTRVSPHVDDQAAWRPHAP
jgi:Tol biopolymer transport system component